MRPLTFFNPFMPNRPFDVISQAQPGHVLRVVRYSGPPIREMGEEERNMLATYPCKEGVTNQLTWRQTDPPTRYFVELRPWPAGRQHRDSLSAPPDMPPEVRDGQG